MTSGFAVKIALKKNPIALSNAIGPEVIAEPLMRKGTAMNVTEAHSMRMPIRAGTFSRSGVQEFPQPAV